MENYFYYKNFKMGTELNISGNFIYDGIQYLYLMEDIEDEGEGEVFSFFYNISVGIERLQKIILALAENITDRDQFLNDLKTHSHQSLNERIMRRKKIDFSSREIAFLSLISNFYKESRYQNYSVKSDKSIDREYINPIYSEEIKKFYSKYLNNNEVFNLERCKTLFSRTIGTITMKYYKRVRELCSEKNIYTYELKSSSKAFKVFLNQHDKNCLLNIFKNDTNALKELLLYLINSDDGNILVEFFDEEEESDATFELLNEIKPLDIERCNIPAYVQSILKGKISTDMVDEIQWLQHEEEDNLRDRLNMLDIIGHRISLVAHEDVEK
ncbi:hypothetical protein OCF65_27955 [Bacillus toyonensis]|uniref:hypothetical protein n=1 Tax=Bacillus toyonensis TaxID=155322 RepID=UPI0021D1E9FE|nr:hypothetical protein [Bacillus toyonensis]MCU5584207.1 hypothetical protein [Bacillus toyonensis]